MEQALGCHLFFELDSFSIINPHIQIHSLKAFPKTIYPTHDSWTCQGGRYKIGFSWLSILREQSIHLTIQVDNVKVYSTYKNQQLAIALHIQRILEKTNFPIDCVLNFLHLKNSMFTIHSDEHATAIELRLHGSSKRINDILKSKITITDAKLAINNTMLAHNGIGTVELESKNGPRGLTCSANIETTFLMPCMQQTNYFFSGKWENDHGRFMLRNADDSCNVNPIIITQRQQVPWLQLNCQLRIVELCSIISKICPSMYLPNLSGSCAIKLATSLNSDLTHMDGTVIMNDMQMQTNGKRAYTSLAVTKRNKDWNSEFSMRIPSICDIKGTGNWSQDTRLGQCNLFNISSIAVPYAPYWKIEPNAAQCTMTINQQNAIEGIFSCITNHKILHTTVSTDGQINTQGTLATISGTTGDKRYAIRLDAGTFPFLMAAKYHDNKNSIDLLNIEVDQNRPVQESTHFNGTVDMNLIQSLVQSGVNHQLQAEGIVLVEGSIDADKINTHLSFKDGTIRLPHTYNFVHTIDANCSYAIAQKLFTITRAQCDLYAGSFSIPYCKIQLDDDHNLEQIYLPLLLNRCLLNMDQELFAMVSGNLLLGMNAAAQPCLSGNLILDKSHLKENILSYTLRNQFAKYAGSMISANHPSLSCNVTIETKEPTQIDTAFLQANAQAHITIENSISSPQITGTIKFLSGTLLFPYKPLNLTKGTLRFLPGYNNDPLIELSAKNTIKKNTITLHVTGSLQNKDLIFESTPPLTDEQIISLLMVGCANESLNVMAPALIMNNLHKLIFGTEQSSVLHSYFKPLTKQFSINLIPSFTDQSGRGGLRGTLEIEINDQLRASIQKNFSLTEDTRFEIEYAATDNVTVRGTRNERRDLGCEVEMRWKF